MLPQKKQIDLVADERRIAVSVISNLSCFFHYILLRLVCIQIENNIRDDFVVQSKRPCRSELHQIGYDLGSIASASNDRT